MCRKCQNLQTVHLKKTHDEMKRYGIIVDVPTLRKVFKLGIRQTSFCEKSRSRVGKDTAKSCLVEFLD